MGLLIAILFLPIIHPTRRHHIIVTFLRLVAGAGAVTLFFLLLRNFYSSGDPTQACSWCRYLSCIPTTALVFVSFPRECGTDGTGRRNNVLLDPSLHLSSGTDLVLSLVLQRNRPRDPPFSLLQSCLRLSLRLTPDILPSPAIASLLVTPAKQMHFFNPRFPIP
jgi:hypothetical protein